MVVDEIECFTMVGVTRCYMTRVTRPSRPSPRSPWSRCPVPSHTERHRPLYLTPYGFYCVHMYTLPVFHFFGGKGYCVHMYTIACIFSILNSGSLVEHVQDMSRTSPPDVHLSLNSCQLIISYGHQVTLTILVPCPVAVLNFES